MNWKTVVSNFYPDLDEAVKKAEKELDEVEIADEVSDELCDVCGRNMVIKYGPHGKFLACPGFPECRNTKPYFEKIGVACPKCGKEVVIRKTKKGITDAKRYRSVILWYGRSLPKKSVSGAAVLCSSRETSWSALTSSVVL